jgi:hypothetical protein
MLDGEKQKKKKNRREKERNLFFWILLCLSAIFPALLGLDPRETISQLVTRIPEYSIQLVSKAFAYECKTYFSLISLLLTFSMKLISDYNSIDAYFT